MKLYYFETPSPRQPCAVAKHLGLPVEYVCVDLSKRENYAPEYLAINPNGKVPALQDGALKLWEANAIMCYLAEKADSDLWPTNPMQRIEVMRWLSWNAVHFSRHAGSLFFENMIKPKFGMGAPNAAIVAEAATFFARFAAVLDEQLSRNEYVAGPNLTIADFALGAFLPTAAQSGIPLEPFAHMRHWYARLDALPAWREPFPPRAVAA